MIAQKTCAFEQLCQFTRETALLVTAQELLGWDERTMLPLRAGAYRAEQITCLAGVIHRRSTDPQIGRWLEQLADDSAAADPHSDRGATIRLLRRDYEKKCKLPQALVEELTRAVLLGQQAWSQAREQDDFGSFQPLLERICELKRQQAAALGFADEPYDALLDEYEPQARTADIAGVLDALRQELAPLVASIGASSRQPHHEILHRHYPTLGQWELGERAAAVIGFDFERGLLDVTQHPFCTRLGPHDCRIATRFDERFFSPAFFGIMHEAGHGIYDQGLRSEQFGLPPGDYVSLGIHESQSRMWENMVCRSAAFWQHLYPETQRLFPDALANVSLDEFHRAINGVRPSLIRVEADEATYNLHIIIRFELERALLDGDLAVGELPGAWRDKYRQYLDIEPPNDADGVLQDIHWSAGLIGYFPTYTLGNLYAAQFFEQADADLGGLDRQFAEGEFRPLRQWLQENIHCHGRCYSAAELAERVTGRPLSHQPLMDYLNGKLKPLYGIR